MHTEPLDVLPDLEDSKDCLERAVKCEAMAMSDAAGKQQGMLLYLAERWREIAREIETRRQNLPEQPTKRTLLGGH